MNRRPKDVDEYIAQAPKEAQSKLGEMRAAIKVSVPDALEKISYGMPFLHIKDALRILPIPNVTFVSIFLADY